MPPGDRFGERIASLEQRYEFLMQRVDSLDSSIDQVKRQSEENAELVRENAKVWDSRWFFAKGVFWAVCAAGAILGTIGIVRLNEIVNLLARFK